MKSDRTRAIDPKILVASSIGNMLEFYDFTLYGFFVAIISPLYFPSTDPFVSLISGFGVFAVGFLTRPIGGIIFGHIGDKYGRKKALSLSLLLTALPTLLIGCLPTYEKIGVIAPILLICARLLQGLSAGGEYNGAGIFVVEHSKPEKRGFLGSILTFSGIVGALLASLIGAFFTHSEMPEWSWRVPFIFGVVLAVVGFYLRSNILESPEFKKHSGKESRKRIPFMDVIKERPRALLACVLVGSNSSIIFYLVLVYVNSVLMTDRVLTASNMLVLNAVMLVVCAISIPFMGFLSDKIGHKKTMLVSASLILFFSFPAAAIFNSQNLWLIIPMQGFLLILNEGFTAPSNAFMSHLFPPEYRYSGIAFGYSLGLCLFGGTAPYVVSWLVKTTQNPYMLAVCMTYGAFFGLSALFITKNYRKTYDPSHSQRV